MPRMASSLYHCTQRILIVPFPTMSSSFGLLEASPSYACKGNLSNHFSCLRSQFDPLCLNLRAELDGVDFLDYGNPTSLFKERLSQPGVVIGLCHFMSPFAVVRPLVFKGRYV